MFLNYLALIILLMGLTLVFYGFIYIHDLPHTIAKKREHPHEEAIHVACWLSLFTLHAMWPIVYIWALTHKKQPEGSAHAEEGARPEPAVAGKGGVPTLPAFGRSSDPALERRIAELEYRLRAVGILDDVPPEPQLTKEGK